MNPVDYEVYVQLFQEFTITYQKEAIQMNAVLPKQALNLLQVLILFHGKIVSKEILMEVLWEENENPDSALKFHIYRLRKLLREIPLFVDLEMIQTDKNGYRFNPDISWESDCHLFEEYASDLSKVKIYRPEDFHKMKILHRLYKGKLFHISSSLWFMQKEEQYRSIYIRYLSFLCQYCIDYGRYEDVKDIASKAIGLEPSIEDHYYYLILAYVKLEQASLANEFYQKAVHVLSNEYEIELSDKMKDLYVEMVGENKNRKSIQDIMSEYRTKKFDKGAFYCSSAVFDYIFEQRLRDAKRLCADYYLFVFEIDMKDSTSMEESMQKLKHTLLNTLRCGDAFAKLNGMQYIALLTCPTPEIAYNIAQRVSKAFRSKTKKMDGKINYHLQKIN